MPGTAATIVERDGVITVTLARPEKRNAINREITDALWEAVELLAERDDLRAMVITATGEYFTAGIDLNAIPGERDGQRIFPESAYRRAFRKHHLLYDEFESVEKPIVLAAQGHCLGAGVEMAASCDFRLAASTVTFALPEARLGVIAASGGTSRLTRLIGPHWAKWVALAAQPIDAELARNIGFVHAVFEPDDFDDGVERFVRDLISIPQECLALGKLAVDMAADVDRISARHVERIANTMLTASDEFRARTARFRKPRD
jgi:enoyl-CoA hydratase